MMDKLQILMAKMGNIQYGFVDGDRNIYFDSDENWDNSFSKYYRLQILDQLEKTKYGVCWDQVELERYYLKKMGIESKSYFIVAYDGKIYPTHTFLVVNDDNKYYWFEHSWEPYRGIHEFDSIDKLLLDVKNKFIKMLINRGISTTEIVIYEYEEPMNNLDCLEFFKHCESGKTVNLDN